MPRVRLRVQTITPLLMYGADNKDDRSNPSIRQQPELRAPSIRGILRYWLRAVLGRTAATVSDVFAQESQILGSTETGSRVKVRVQRTRAMQTPERVTVMPRQTRGYTLSHDGFAPDIEFGIVLATHPLDETRDGRPHLFDADSDLMKAVFLMVYFGGLGRRSRRGSGNLSVLDAQGYEGEPPLAVRPADQAELAGYLSRVSEHVSPRSYTLGYRPDFPVFAWDTAAVLIGQQTHATYEDAFNELWNVSGPYHDEGGIFGDVRPRRSSAIHMRVSMTQAGYVAQQTILYAGSGRWGAMQDYIRHCVGEGFHDIYGTWGHWK